MIQFRRVDGAHRRQQIVIVVVLVIVVCVRGAGVFWTFTSSSSTAAATAAAAVAAATIAAVQAIFAGQIATEFRRQHGDARLHGALDQIVEGEHPVRFDAVRTQHGDDGILWKQQSRRCTQFDCKVIATC